MTDDHENIPSFPRIRVRRSKWVYGEGQKYPILRLVQPRNSDGKEFALFLPYEEARNLVDRVHDACDDYEASQRQAEQPSESPSIQGDESP